MRIGCGRLGAIGLPMARSLLRSGHAVRGFDRSPVVLDACAEACGEPAAATYRLLNRDSG